MKEVAATTASNGQQVHDQRSGAIQSESAHRNVHDGAAHDSHDVPMVYETPNDYRSSALERRRRLIAEGADPGSVVLQSEISTYAPRQANESSRDYAKRYVDKMNAMIGAGVLILNDMCTADVQASGFGTANGRFFDLGPGSGATKGEFRDFTKWFDETDYGTLAHEVPEKWRKFMKPNPPRD